MTPALFYQEKKIYNSSSTKIITLIQASLDDDQNALSTSRKAKALRKNSEKMA